MAMRHRSFESSVPPQHGPRPAPRNYVSGLKTHGVTRGGSTGIVSQFPAGGGANR
jgi:hypothetical protein